MSQNYFLKKRSGLAEAETDTEAESTELETGTSSDEETDHPVKPIRKLNNLFSKVSINDNEKVTISKDDLKTIMNEFMSEQMASAASTTNSTTTNLNITVSDEVHTDSVNTNNTKSNKTRSNTTISKASSNQSAILETIDKIITSNSQITNQPRTFGHKFLISCVSCALAGRHGYNNNSNSLDLNPVVQQLKNCSNNNGYMNVTRMSYIGHIIIYYWHNDLKIKNALKARFGGMAHLIESENKVISSIGAIHLWKTPKNWSNITGVKKKILQEYQEKFHFDENAFTKVLKSLGIN